MIKIENLPMPNFSKPGVRSKYPWTSIKIGECFQHEANSITVARTHASMMSQYEKKFRAKVVNNKIYIWRIA